MKSGDILRIKWQTEYYFLHGLFLLPYKIDTSPGVLAAWFKGVQN
jgi:hypothetical protein